MQVAMLNVGSSALPNTFSSDDGTVFRVQSFRG